MSESVTDRAVLLVGHGTIENSSDVPEFLRRIRRGRPAPEAFVSEIRRRYDHIGGSPLLSTTKDLGRKIAVMSGTNVAVAMRYWDPLIADVLRDELGRGVRDFCVIPVAPFSVHVYEAVVKEALAALHKEGEAEALSVRVRAVPTYGDHPGLVEANAKAVEPFLRDARAGETALVLTAHSLPAKVIAMGDPYQREFEKSAAAIGARLSYPFTLAYQSQGEGNDEWLGPTLLSALEAAKASGAREVIVAPVGFLADHVETLYDLDVEAAGQAKALGLGFRRVPALGSSDALAAVLSQLAREAFA